MSNGQPGTSSDSSSNLSAKDQWLREALGIEMADYGSSVVEADAKVASDEGDHDFAAKEEREGKQPPPQAKGEPQGKQPPPQAKAGGGDPGVKPHRTRITTVTVAGTKRDLWALVDKDSITAQSGGKPPLNVMTSINRAALELVTMNDKTLLVRVPIWKREVDAVRATATKAAGELKQAEATKGGLTKQGGTFFGDVNNYLKALATVRALSGEIKSAQLAYEKSLAELDAAVAHKEFEEGKDDVDKKKAELDAKKAELAEAQEIFGKVLEIGKKVATADWKGLADQAIGYVKDKATEAVRDAILDQLYAVDIKRLTDALEEAKKKTAVAKAKWLEKAVEASTLGMSKAANDFDNARGKLKAALDDLARNQGNAVRALQANPSTKKLGELIEQRSGQLVAIGKAREVVRSFLNVVDSVIEQARSLRQQYARLSTEISHVKDDPVYRTDSAWGKEVLAVAVINADLMVRVADATGGLQSDALNALKYLGSDAPDGPMGPYNKAIETVDKTLQG